MTKKLRLLLDRDRHSNGIVSISMRESPRMLSYFYWVGFNTCDAALNAELGERNIFHCRQTRMRKALMKSHRIFSAFPAHSVKCASVFLFASIASASHAQVMPPTGAPTTSKGGAIIGQPPGPEGLGGPFIGQPTPGGHTGSTMPAPPTSGSRITQPLPPPSPSPGQGRAGSTVISDPVKDKLDRANREAADIDRDGRLSPEEAARIPPGTSLPR